jgi:hypothetical protein
MTDHDATWISLPLPVGWSPPMRAEFLDAARVLLEGPSDSASRKVIDSPSLDTAMRAALSVVWDLVQQGWPARITTTGHLEVRPADANASPEKEKERVRQQELTKTREQLRSSSVRNFIRKMETPRERGGEFVSIFNLMRDGEQLAELLDRWRRSGAEPADLRAIIDPYVQVVESGKRCEQTGLPLTDIWRYFRHTWSNHYTTTPGRTMLMLVRDAAAPFHPVIGLASLASAVVQIHERDAWIGWQSEQVLHHLEAGRDSDAQWLMRRLNDRLSELHLDDLIADELYWPGLWDSPTRDAIDRLRTASKKSRRDHNRFGRSRDFTNHAGDDPTVWVERAESDLYRSKRCSVLADLLSARMALLPYLSPEANGDRLQAAMSDPAARRAASRIVRFTRGETVGTEIADLTVCGALAPYNHLLGGKLVSMLAVSPHVASAYHARYSGYASQIASALAGRPIRRPSHLAFVGTTSLYGSGSSQYNRVLVPGVVLGSSSRIEYVELGRSRSFGTSHFSAKTLDALVTLAEQSRHGRRVNSIFGEGASPKLRKVRDGIDLLGWPANDLLQHRRERIVYGVPLVNNLRDYLLKQDCEPDFKFDPSRTDARAVADWWAQRWLTMRAQKPEILARVASHRLNRPVDHGARVRLPDSGDLSENQPQLTDTFRT